MLQTSLALLKRFQERGRKNIFCFGRPRGQSPHASANSLDKARIWLLAACSLSSEDRRSGGPSIPTTTWPESSRRIDVKVNLYEPGPSSTSAILAVILKTSCTGDLTSE